jgi:hypothetical protein
MDTFRVAKRDELSSAYPAMRLREEPSDRL